MSGGGGGGELVKGEQSVEAVELPPPSDAAPRGTDGRTDRGDSPLSSPHPKPHTGSTARRAATSTATDSVARRIQMALLPSFTMLVRPVGVRVALEDVYLFGLDTGGIESVLSSRLSSSGRSLQCVRKTWAKGGSKREVRISCKTSHKL